MKDRYRRVFERAALRKLMEACEARASAAAHGHMLQTYAAQGIDDGDDWSAYRERMDIWGLKTLLHLVDEPIIPDLR